MRILHALCLVAVVTLLGSGCASTGQQQLDPTGIYQGDKVLYDADGAILEADRIFDEIEGVATRNAAYVSTHAGAAAFVAKIVSGRAGWIRSAIAARDTYARTKSAADLSSLQGQVDFLRGLLEQARPMLLESLASQPQPNAP